MKYKAIIFDLFGTLVDNMHHAQFQAVLGRMAALVQAPADRFEHLWNRDTWPMRSTGTLRVPGAIEYICHQLGINPAPEQIKQAADLRYSFTRDMLVPRPDAVETLTILKTAGYRLGLISDCTEDT
ncbi:MAG: hypothetical protein J2P36_30200, partial [Ktedonobacteraceae bacterium]|nr:hypothetical protein [Ktedonobacteraceae bacterium]